MILIYLLSMLRVIDIFTDYFGDCKESLIKENYVVVYELLDEMLDNGYPLATESNILKELIKPPNLLRTIANTVTGKSNVSATLPSGQLSNVPWRRAGVKYANNEAYFDCTEEIDIQGYIDCGIKRSGLPDLSLSFVNPNTLFFLMKILKFLRARHVMERRVIHLLNRKTMLCNLTNNPLMEIRLKTVLNVNLSPNQGKYSFDPVSKLLVWEIGRIETGKSPFVRGTINLSQAKQINQTNLFIYNSCFILICFVFY
uniref:MHD domain-containing protein n=1 Tax=Tetranychus urticae TaxID=32264 RepID=T1L4X3_TETUR